MYRVGCGATPVLVVRQKQEVVWLCVDYNYGLSNARAFWHQQMAYEEGTTFRKGNRVSKISYR
jgi:hypothetical protein